MRRITIPQYVVGSDKNKQVLIQFAMTTSNLHEKEFSGPLFSFDKENKMLLLFYHNSLPEPQQIIELRDFPEDIYLQMKTNITAQIEEHSASDSVVYHTACKLFFDGNTSFKQ